METLRVVEAKPGDVGRGLARIDPIVADRLGITTGDILEITGKKRTVAISWPGYPEDAGRSTIRIDGAIRRNADVRIDDKVEVEKIEGEDAQEVTLAPTELLRIMDGEAYLSRLLENRPISLGDYVELNVMGRRIDLVVTGYRPKADAVIVRYHTRVTVSEKPVKEVKEVPRVRYEDIGGLKEEIRKVREMIELPLRHPEVFERLGIEPPKGVLLHGAPGTGKTLLAKAVANESNANFVSISGPEVMSKFYGESEERIRELFKQAEESAPSIIFIDEIDSIAPKREEVTGEVERRVVAQLLALMDGMEARGKVIVIGATNRVNAIDPALRRPGRFDREIELGIPDKDARLETLQIHTRGMPLDESVDLKYLANITHGFVGADLSALSKEAGMRALRRVLPNIDLEAEQIPADILNQLVVTQEDFLDALREIEPSALREVFIETPDVSWDDIGGLESAKESLKEAVEWPLRYPDLFKHMNAKPPKGVLLFGPPGTGKTLLAKAVAKESEANFISVKGPEFLSKWVGESEKAVREMFRKARQAAPCIVFFDEIDSITPTRGLGFDSHVTERVISQILTELDGLEELRDVVIIAATNRPDIIDTALLRPGRFDRLVYITPPDPEARKKIFEIHLKDKPIAEDISIDRLVKKTEGYTGADIAAVCNEAVMSAIREAIGEGKAENPDETKVAARHMDMALEKVKGISKTDLDKYCTICETFDKGSIIDRERERERGKEYV